MWADDATSRELGLQLISVEPGQAVLAMTVSEAMVNWHHTCHGGFIYLLADTAFGYACNSRNQRMVAQYCSINYLTPAQRGERLTARATERHLEGRSGIYDVAVTRADGTAIAEFRGHARAIAGNIVTEPK
ncbi:MAG: hydroxyphenylacetyl-CoA thioesterase PaaI [Rhizobiales bacterium]|nr:hydroxyphenylacetyl-CoA thioesterase PaaI [Hyphomicrobiales bacterium]